MAVALLTQQSFALLYCSNGQGCSDKLGLLKKLFKE